MNPAIRAPHFSRLRVVAPLLCVAALAACASTPAPTAALAAGASSYETARSAGAPEFAAAELNSARTKLEQARALAQAGKNREATRLAEQAEADAQLARAMSASERSRRAVAEVDASLRTLREEISRSATGSGPATTTPVVPTGAPRAP